MLKFLWIFLLALPVYGATYKLKVVENKTKDTYNPETKKMEAVHYIAWGACNAIDASKYGYKGDRYAITAAHLISDAKEVWIENWKSEVVKVDIEFDVALLKCEKDLKCYELTSSHKEVSVFHAPLGKNIRESKALIIKSSEIKWEIKVDEFNHGSSGGGVVCDGMLFGVCVSMESEEHKEKGYFLPIKRIRQFLAVE